MRCGSCGGKLKVTKVAYTAQHIRRRRKCQSCGEAWTTREVFDEAWIEVGGVVMSNSGRGNEK